MSRPFAGDAKNLNPDQLSYPLKGPLMSHLFSEFKLRDVAYANRIGVSPMCQYSCEDGFANDWHFAHLAARAVGGAGLVFTEAAAVTPEGRISPQDLGVWSDKHFEPLERIASFVKAQGAVPGVQLAHAGRKGSTYRPWSGQGSMPEAQGGWQAVAPSPIAFGKYAPPKELSIEGIRALSQAFATAARRAYAAGFRTIEVHAAHGYLVHQFLSPLSNRRADAYGGSFDNRTRFLRDCVAAVRGRPARFLSAVRPHFGHRLDRRRLGHRAVDRAFPPAEGPRRRRDRLLVGRQCRECENSGRAGLSGSILGNRSPRSRSRDGGRRHDH